MGLGTVGHPEAPYGNEAGDDRNTCCRVKRTRGDVRGRHCWFNSLMNTSDYRIRPGQRVVLEQTACDDDGGLNQATAIGDFKSLTSRLIELQRLLYAENKHKLLIVLQGMDCSGKDSTVRHVFGPVNPQGCRVTSFKVPSAEEASHDYLWRIHAHAPPRGMIALFNRSHYESVIVERVKGIVPRGVWSRRFDHINDFERMLSEEGTTLLKFFLHISKGYQKKQLQRRLSDPGKHWKMDLADIRERRSWDKYQRAYEDALERCSTTHAPWHVVPAENKWFRNWLIASVVVGALERLKMKYPKPQFDPKKIRIA